MPDRDHAKLALLIAMADDELMLGHRHSEWTGWAPMIEIDLAFSSIAQDEIAHARLLYELAEPLDGRDPDALALGRPPGEYRNAIVCERPNVDWAWTLARQYLYDTADDVRLEALEASTWTELAQAVNVIRLEERYHLEHAHLWMRRLVDHDQRARMNEAIQRARGEVLGVFEPIWESDVLVREGITPSPQDLQKVFTARVDSELAAYGFEPADWTLTAGGGRAGQRSNDFDAMWQELTGLYRSEAGATW